MKIRWKLLLILIFISPTFSEAPKYRSLYERMVARRLTSISKKRAKVEVTTTSTPKPNLQQVSAKYRGQQSRQELTSTTKRQVLEVLDIFETSERIRAQMEQKKYPYLANEGNPLVPKMFENYGSSYTTRRNPRYIRKPAGIIRGGFRNTFDPRSAHLIPHPDQRHGRRHRNNTAKVATPKRKYTVPPTPHIGPPQIVTSSTKLDTKTSVYPVETLPLIGNIKTTTPASLPTTHMTKAPTRSQKRRNKYQSRGKTSTRKVHSRTRYDRTTTTPSNHENKKRNPPEDNSQSKGNVKSTKPDATTKKYQRKKPKASSNQEKYKKTSKKDTTLPQTQLKNQKFTKEDLESDQKEDNQQQTTRNDPKEKDPQKSTKKNLNTLPKNHEEDQKFTKEALEGKKDQEKATRNGQDKLDKAKNEEDLNQKPITRENQEVKQKLSKKEHQPPTTALDKTQSEEDPPKSSEDEQLKEAKKLTKKETNHSQPQGDLKKPKKTLKSPTQDNLKKPEVFTTAQKPSSEEQSTKKENNHTQTQDDHRQLKKKLYTTENSTKKTKNKIGKHFNGDDKVLQSTLPKEPFQSQGHFMEAPSGTLGTITNTTSGTPKVNTTRNAEKFLEFFLPNLENLPKNLGALDATTNGDNGTQKEGTQPELVGQVQGKGSTKTNPKNLHRNVESGSIDTMKNSDSFLNRFVQNLTLLNPKGGLELNGNGSSGTFPETEIDPFTDHTFPDEDTSEVFHKESSTEMDMELKEIEDIQDELSKDLRALKNFKGSSGAIEIGEQVIKGGKDAEIGMEGNKIGINPLEQVMSRNGRPMHFMVNSTTAFGSEGEDYLDKDYTSFIPEKQSPHSKNYDYDAFGRGRLKFLDKIRSRLSSVTTSKSEERKKRKMIKKVQTNRKYIIRLNTKTTQIPQGIHLPQDDVTNSTTLGPQLQVPVDIGRSSWDPLSNETNGTDLENALDGSSNMDDPPDEDFVTVFPNTTIPNALFRKGPSQSEDYKSHKGRQKFILGNRFHSTTKEPESKRGKYHILARQMKQRFNDLSKMPWRKNDIKCREQLCPKAKMVNDQKSTTTQEPVNPILPDGNNADPNKQTLHDILYKLSQEIMDILPELHKTLLKVNQLDCQNTTESVPPNLLTDPPEGAQTTTARNILSTEARTQIYDYTGTDDEVYDRLKNEITTSMDPFLTQPDPYLSDNTDYIDNSGWNKEPTMPDQIIDFDTTTDGQVQPLTEMNTPNAEAIVTITPQDDLSEIATTPEVPKMLLSTLTKDENQPAQIEMTTITIPEDTQPTEMNLNPTEMDGIPTEAIEPNTPTPEPYNLNPEEPPVPCNPGEIGCLEQPLNSSEVLCAPGETGIGCSNQPTGQQPNLDYKEPERIEPPVSCRPGETGIWCKLDSINFDNKTVVFPKESNKVPIKDVLFNPENFSNETISLKPVDVRPPKGTDNQGQDDPYPSGNSQLARLVSSLDNGKTIKIVAPIINFHMGDRSDGSSSVVIAPNGTNDLLVNTNTNSGRGNQDPSANASSKEAPIDPEEPEPEMVDNREVLNIPQEIEETPPSSMAYQDPNPVTNQATLQQKQEPPGTAVANQGPIENPLQQDQLPPIEANQEIEKPHEQEQGQNEPLPPTEVIQDPNQGIEKPSGQEQGTYREIFPKKESLPSSERTAKDVVPAAGIQDPNQGIENPPQEQGSYREIPPKKGGLFPSDKTAKDVKEIQPNDSGTNIDLPRKQIEENRNNKNYPTGPKNPPDIPLLTEQVTTSLEDDSGKRSIGKIEAKTKDSIITNNPEEQAQHSTQNSKDTNQVGILEHIGNQLEDHQPPTNTHESLKAIDMPLGDDPNDNTASNNPGDNQFSNLDPTGTYEGPVGPGGDYFPNQKASEFDSSPTGANPHNPIGPASMYLTGPDYNDPENYSETNPEYSETGSGPSSYEGYPPNDYSGPSGTAYGTKKTNPTDSSKNQSGIVGTGEEVQGGDLGEPVSSKSDSLKLEKFPELSIKKKPQKTNKIPTKFVSDDSGREIRDLTSVESSNLNGNNNMDQEKDFFKPPGGPMGQGAVLTSAEIQNQDGVLMTSSNNQDGYPMTSSQNQNGFPEQNVSDIKFSDLVTAESIGFDLVPPKIDLNSKDYDLDPPNDFSKDKSVDGGTKSQSLNQDFVGAPINSKNEEGPIVTSEGNLMTSSGNGIRLTPMQNGATGTDTSSQDGGSLQDGDLMSKNQRFNLDPNEDIDAKTMQNNDKLKVIENDMVKNISEKLPESYMRLLIESRHFDPHDYLTSKNKNSSHPHAIVIPIVPKNSSFYSNVKGMNKDLNISVQSFLKRQINKPLLAVLMLASSNDSMKAFADLRRATKINVLTPPHIVTIPKRTKKDIHLIAPTPFSFNSFLSDLKHLKVKRELAKYPTEYSKINMAVVAFDNQETLKNDLNLLKQKFDMDFAPPLSSTNIDNYINLLYEQKSLKRYV